MYHQDQAKPPPHTEGGAATGIPVSYGRETSSQSHPHPASAASYSSQYYEATVPEYKPPVEWSTGLCHCFSDCPNCCLSFWCPCVTFGRVAEILDKGSTSCGASGALYALITCVIGCGCLYSCFYRSKMRREYNIKGNGCSDCLTHCFCESCALSQEHRELENRGFDMILGWHGNVEKRTRGVVMAATTPPTLQHAINR